MDTMRVKNFKAFKDSGLLKLAKINLIVGKNSAGKSSLMKAILGCSQTASERKVDSSDFRLVGMHTDLGTYKDTVHGNDENTNLSISFGIQGPNFSSGAKKYQFEYEYSKGPRLITASVAGVKAFCDGDLICSAKAAYKNQKRFPGTPQLVLTQSIIHKQLFNSDGPDFNDDKDIPEFFRKLNTLFTEENKKQKGEGRVTANFIALDDFNIEILQLKKEKGKLKRLNIFGVSINAAYLGMDRASSELDRMLTGCIYLGPVREEPARSARLAISSGRYSGKKGEDLAVMLHTALRDQAFKDQFNNYLQKLHIADSIETSESFLEISGEKKLTGYINILLGKNGQYHSLVDVGFGTSQVLPIVFELMAQENRLILIEQPELHLHPSAQAEIGELLNDSIKSGNQLFIETHSVVLIERIRRLIRTGELSNDDVRIIYVHGDDSGASVCKQIGFLSDGDFDQAWPEKDFFGEREAETLSDWW